MLNHAPARQQAFASLTQTAANKLASRSFWELIPGKTAGNCFDRRRGTDPHLSLRRAEEKVEQGGAM